MAGCSATYQAGSPVGLHFFGFLGLVRSFAGAKKRAPDAQHSPAPRDPTPPPSSPRPSLVSRRALRVTRSAERTNVAFIEREVGARTPADDVIYLGGHMRAVSAHGVRGQEPRPEPPP